MALRCQIKPTRIERCKQLRHNTSQILDDLFFFLIMICKTHVTLESAYALDDLTHTSYLGSIIVNRGGYALGEGSYISPALERRKMWSQQQ